MQLKDILPREVWQALRDAAEQREFEEDVQEFGLAVAKRRRAQRLRLRA